ncbi:alpha/beta hydrolase [Amycolatopsis sp. H20-H5]|nr:alpha/beta hydrolase [Amycolatopsis sp. H20-H5]MEC3979318.1 alpha/beta hydrolase [Amycolatopsis sp. H20-H5]
MLAGLLSGATLGAPTAIAADNPYARGPAPTVASIEATTGPFAISQTTAPKTSTFGGGTIYYPTSTAEGTYGAIAVSPGFVSPQSAIGWYGPRLASQGFVVITIDTLGLFDLPDSRGTQLLAALKYLVGQSPVKSRIDPARLAVMGHSMGGGGTLEAARSTPTLKAAIPLAGYDFNNNFSSLKVPSLIVGVQNDAIAPVANHSRPFYASLPATLDRAYLELAGGSHSTPNSPNTTIAKYSISWLKRFVDSDTRYEQFLCPIPTGNPAISAFQGNCPHTA